MGSSCGPLAKSELEIIEEIMNCPKCLSSENICKIHMKAVKSILIKEAKTEIEKFTAPK